MNSQLQQAAGSSIWQLVFVSFAIILILFEIVRGWRRGVARQLARLAALVGAYLAAYFGGPFVAPFAAPFLRIPDFAMSILAGAIFAVVIYAIITGLGTIMFRRTRQHESAFVRLLCGLNGAILGIFFGAFLVWLIVVGVRAVGSLAEAPAQQQAAKESKTAPGHALHAVDVRRGTLNEPSEQASVLTSLARLKNSLEMGAVGDIVKRADVVSTNTYEIFGKLGQVVSNSERAERFLSYPGARELSEHPKIVALRDDPEIARMIEQGRLLDLLQNEKVLDVMNDPTIIEQVRNFDLQRALDYALQGK
jgi:uncharacterized membrane protein required for colicin V production